MASEISITRCIEALKGGDHDAAQRIWEAYFHRLVGLARVRLRDAPRRAADEEDVALSAFDSFCRGAAAGRFPRLDDRHDLWQLLVLLTVRKALDLRQHEGRLVRGGGKVQTLSDLADQGLDPTQAGEPGPEMAAQVIDQYRCLMGRLEDPSLRAVVNWKLEGYTNDEVADRIGCVTSTVERKLKRIRDRWAKEEVS